MNDNLATFEAAAVLRWWLSGLPLSPAQVEEGVQMGLDVGLFDRVGAEYQRIICEHFGLPQDTRQVEMDLEVVA